MENGTTNAHLFLRICNSTWHNTNHAFRITNHALGFKWSTIHALGILNENYDHALGICKINFWFTHWESWMKHMNVGYYKHSIPRSISVTVNISHRQNKSKVNMLPTKKIGKFEKGCQSMNEWIIYEKPITWVWSEP